jgi:hypothetical protein
VGVLASAIASLGYLVPVVVGGWSVVAVVRKWRKPATV